MCDQQGEPELYIQHQYMCSECGQLFNTLEEVILHQQEHTGPDAEGAGGSEEEVAGGALGLEEPQLCLAGLGGVLGGLSDSQYQCLECGTLLRAPEELLLHQELHMREGGTALEAGEHEGVLRAERGKAERGGVENGGVEGEREGEGEVVIIHPYECSECALLFHTPEDFLHHQGEHFLGQDKESGEGVMETGVSGGGGEGEAIEVEEAGEGEEEVGFCTAPPATPLQCAECQRSFSSANRLSAHRRVHEQGTHECPECRKVFKKPGSLETHLRTHSGEARHLCLDCGLGFATEMTLIMHRKSHTAEPLHRCQFCAKTFTNMTKFLYHRRTHGNRPPPPGTTERESEREREAWAAVGAAESACVAEEMKIEMATPGSAPCEMGRDTIAGESDRVREQPETEKGGGEEEEDGRRRRELGPEPGPELASDSMHEDSNSKQDAVPHHGCQHPTAVTTSPRPSSYLDFTCPSCPKRFPSQLRLLRHRRAVHGSERRFRCGVCGKPFKKQVHVRNHLRTHTGERPYQCSDCGKTFSSLANLSRHGLTHSGERPHRCDMCPRAFSQASNLRQHRLLHARPAPFPCPDCPAGFVRPAKLALHRYARHPGAPPPYPCTLCPAGFLRKRLLDQHCEEQHPLRPGEGEVVARGRNHPPATATAAEPHPASPSCLPPQLQLHRSSATHSCPRCPKRFVQAMHLAEHLRTHTGERPHACPHCPKRFKTFSNLRSHRRTHSRAIAATTAAPSIVCTELGDTITIIETSEQALPLTQAIEMYHTVLDNGLDTLLQH
ncbi:ZN574 protein, partial [Amia calva]|nr:ZN574 protein [Amia calva]